MRFAFLLSTIISKIPLSDDVALIFTACDLAKDSRKCSTQDTSFYCKECQVKKHCSLEDHRRVLKWLDSNCQKEVSAYALLISYIDKSIFERLLGVL